MPLVQIPAPSRRYPRAKLTGSGLSLPDFSEALVVAANWGIVADYQNGLAPLFRLSGSVDDAVDIFAKTTAPYYCDLESVEDLGLPILTCDRWNNQIDGGQFDAADPTITYAINGRSNNIRVVDAGTESVNGDYIPYGMVNSKMSWTPTGIGDPTETGIYWNGIDRWIIAFDSDVMYRGIDDVASPDLVNAWSQSSGAAPVPAVTMFSTLTAGEITINAL